LQLAVVIAYTSGRQLIINYSPNPLGPCNGYTIQMKPKNHTRKSSPLIGQNGDLLGKVNVGCKE